MVAIYFRGLATCIYWDGSVGMHLLILEGSELRRKCFQKIKIMVIIYLFKKESSFIYIYTIYDLMKLKKNLAY